MALVVELFHLGVTQDDLLMLLAQSFADSIATMPLALTYFTFLISSSLIRSITNEF